eukprot:g76088.t1
MFVRDALLVHRRGFPKAARSIFHRTGRASCDRHTFFSTLHQPTQQSSTESLSIASELNQHVAPAQSAWPNVRLFETLICDVHEWGLPWWASVASIALGARCLLLPVQFWSLKLGARLARIRAPLELLNNVWGCINIEYAVKRKHLRSVRWRLYRQTGWPAGLFALPLLHFPLIVSCSIACQRIALTDPTFATGGGAWFQNLLEPDPHFALPLVTAGMWYLNAVTHTSRGIHSPSDVANLTPQMFLMRSLRDVYPIMLIISVPILSRAFPAFVWCYLFPSAALALASSALLKLPATRSALGIQANVSSMQVLLPSDLPDPKVFKLLKEGDDILPTVSRIEHPFRNFIDSNPPPPKTLKDYPFLKHFGTKFVPPPRPDAAAGTKAVGAKVR